MIESEADKVLEIRVSQFAHTFKFLRRITCDPFRCAMSGSEDALCTTYVPMQRDPRDSLVPEEHILWPIEVVDENKTAIPCGGCGVCSSLKRDDDISHQRSLPLQAIPNAANLVVTFLI
jgi:hypothetical protein